MIPRSASIGRGNVELKIDIDTKVKYRSMLRRIKTVNGLLGLVISEIDIRETKRGYHLRMIMRSGVQYSDIELLLIQSLMGDDYKRGCLNYKRVMRGEQSWNVLFKRKWKKDNKLRSKEYNYKVVKTNEFGG